VKYVPDPSGRFDRRPHYDPSELDEDCEDTITEFMRQRCGEFRLPIPTDVLTKLIESEAEELDLYADLATEGPEVEGVTHFFADSRPKVQISHLLTQDEGRGHRLRTTLTHEFGHVKFHAPLWAVEFDRQSRYSKPHVNRTPPQQCHRSGILDAKEYDWMEWQAGYISGALLMPESHIRNLAEAALPCTGRRRPSAPDDAAVVQLVADVVGTFNVSEYAAQVRLAKLGYLMLNPRA